MAKKIIKIILSIIGSLIVLLMLLVFLVASGTFNGAIANIIEKQAAKSLNGELTIGEIDGQLVSDFAIRDVSLTHDSDTLLYLSEIKIDYILMGLFRKEIELDLIHIGNLSLDLKQDPDSVWNFMKLTKPTDEVPDTTGSESGWKIIVHDLRLDQFTANISPIDTTGFIPGYAEAEMRLNGSFSRDSINATLRSLRIAVRNPDLEVESFTGTFAKVGAVLSWRNVGLDLPNSLLYTSGSYDTGESGKAEVNLGLEPLDFSDIRVFLPEFGFYGSPEIIASVAGDTARYHFNIEIIEENQKINISGRLDDLLNQPEYLVDLIATNLDYSHWTNNQELKTDISTDLEIRGRGFDLKENDLDLSGTISGISYKEYDADKIILRASKRKDHVTGTLDATTFIADVDLDFDVTKLFEKPVYDLLLDYRDLNVNNLPGIDSLETRLNGSLSVKGTGTTKEDLDARIILRSDASLILGNQIEEFEITGSFDKGDYDFIIPGMATPYFELSAEGMGSIAGSNDISFEFRLLEPDTLLALFGLPDIDISGSITGNVSGPTNSLSVKAKANLSDIVYDSIRISDLDADLDMILAGSRYAGKIILKSQGIGFGDIRVKSVDITGEFSEKNIAAEIQLDYNDSLTAEFTGAVEGFENPVVRIRHLGISYNDAEWNTGHDSAFIVMNENGLEINRFNLNSGEQNIDIHGQFAFEGEEDLTVAISRLDLQALPLDLLMPYNISGYVTSNIILRGTSGKPLIEGFINADDIEVNGIRIDSLRSGLNYENELFSYQGTIDPDVYEPVELALAVPVRVSLNDSTVLLKDSKGFSASVKFDSLDLEKVMTLVPVENISVKGFGSADIIAANTIRNPNVSGVIRITDAGVENKAYGADYENVQFTGRIDSSRITIEELKASTGKGTLDIGGFLDIANTDSLELNNLGMSIKASDFQALESNSFTLNFDSDVTLEGRLGNPEFGGSLGINSSKVNVDYFTAMMSQRTDDPDPPLLIEALRDTIEIAQTAAQDTSGPGFSGNAFYKNMSGELVLDIPGNTWITGKDMNFELEGTMRAVKSADVLNLFGDLNVKRGFYKLYGRTFDFERGEIHFTGGSDFNPDVNFEIVYSFRDIGKELRDLKLIVTGKIMQPSLEFRLDEEMLEEKDAISYIVFGKSVNQLGEGERDKLSGENIAMGAALTQLSGVLKGVLQESAGVDVFEVTGGEDWKSGSVTIGKYITNNLFLSYDRSFDFDKQTKAADTEKIMLEYQFFRNLVLKATNQEINSGFDLIFKKTWR